MTILGQVVIPMKTFKYVGSLVTNQISIQEKIRCILKAGNLCYYSVMHSCMELGMTWFVLMRCPSWQQENLLLAMEFLQDLVLSETPCVMCDCLCNSWYEHNDKRVNLHAIHQLGIKRENSTESVLNSRKLLIYLVTSSVGNI